MSPHVCPPCVRSVQKDPKGTKRSSPYHSADSPRFAGSFRLCYGSGLARDGSTLFLQIERGACIAGKPGSHREICRSKILHSNRPAGRPPRRLLILIYPPHREAERRFCAVGRPAWMPGEPRWAMDGPWRRAHGAGPERGNLSAAKAVRQGQAFLVTFSASGKSDSP